MSSQMKRKPEEFNQNNQNTAKEASSTLSTIGENIQEFGKHATEAVAKKFENIQQNMGEYLHSGKEKAEEYLHTGMEKAKVAEKKLESSIRQYPFRALLIAAGAGLLIGMLRKRN